MFSCDAMPQIHRSVEDGSATVWASDSSLWRSEGEGPDWPCLSRTDGIEFRPLGMRCWNASPGEKLSALCGREEAPSGPYAATPLRHVSKRTAL